MFYVPFQFSTPLLPISMFKQVYNVTKFLEDHPDGDEVLLSATGKDATDDFEDVGHSSSARAMLDEFYVGDIDTSTVPTKTKYTPPKQPHYEQAKTSEFAVKLLQFLVPLLIWDWTSASTSIPNHQLKH
ncbi:Cytochrome b5 [Hibiscus syriacus]|uniref:Cytochrome b5 n=1 Tax=Hibiscus syriacus TaxID=106335 RepID=A0A6A2YYH2_HIBSY|nr:Cytochrome b5 [Hibiscus syriacus]